MHEVKSYEVADRQNLYLTPSMILALSEHFGCMMKHAELLNWFQEMLKKKPKTPVKPQESPIEFIKKPNIQSTRTKLDVHNPEFEALHESRKLRQPNFVNLNILDILLRPLSARYDPQSRPTTLLSHTEVVYPYSSQALNTNEVSKRLLYASLVKKNPKKIFTIRDRVVDMGSIEGDSTNYAMRMKGLLPPKSSK